MKTTHKIINRSIQSIKSIFNISDPEFINSLKFRSILAGLLFSLGLFYTMAANGHLFHNSTSTFDTFYGITGDQQETIELLKCVDEKSFQYAFEYSKPLSAIEDPVKYECLTDWMYAHTKIPTNY